MSVAQTKIMIVEDEAGIREMTKKYLQQAGYNVTTTSNGEQALNELYAINPDLVLLDVEMPGIDGFTVCKEIRKKMTIPIIFLTVRRDTLDKIKCFELGGDDYLTKPFDFEELEARIQANIRRYYTYAATQANILTYGNLEIHLHSYECYIDRVRIDLSTKEMELLIHLAKHPNQVWSKEQLYNQIWEFDAIGNVDTVRVHISYLRKKLEDNHINKQFVQTIHGLGYMFSN